MQSKPKKRSDRQRGQCVRYEGGVSSDTLAFDIGFVKSMLFAPGALVVDAHLQAAAVMALRLGARRLPQQLAQRIEEWRLDSIVGRLAVVHHSWASTVRA